MEKAVVSLVAGIRVELWGNDKQSLKAAVNTSQQVKGGNCTPKVCKEVPYRLL